MSTTIPDPATVKWVPVGPSSPGKDGADGTNGTNGADGAGIPQPVYNGMWVKGVGGAAVWAGITQDDLPGNIGKTCRSWDQADLNNITDSGWYNGSNMGNSPGGRGDWLFILHMCHIGGSSWDTQTCWTMQQAPVLTWTRSKCNNAWQGWTRVGYVEYPQGMGLTNGWTNYPGWPVAQFWKDGSNVVHLDGLVQNGNTGPIGYFPAGYTPAMGGSHMFGCMTDNGVGRVDVQQDGTLYKQSGGNNYLSLAGISFLAAVNT